MKLPIQAQPINRQITATSIQTKGINPSENCGCGADSTCYGLCVLGNCLGACA